MASTVSACPSSPSSIVDNLWWLLTLCVIGIIYGAMVAMVQKDAKKLSGLPGPDDDRPVRFEHARDQRGSVLQMLNHGISTGALFLIVGIIYERRHTRMIADFGGLNKVMPDIRDLLRRHGHVLGRPALPQRVHRRNLDPGRFVADRRSGLSRSSASRWSGG